MIWLIVVVQSEHVRRMTVQVFPRVRSATQKGTRPITVTAIDTYKGRVLEETYPPIADLLLSKNPNKTGNCLKQFTYVQGEGYYITTNRLDAGPELNCANGSSGTAVGIDLHDDPKPGG